MRYTAKLVPHLQPSKPSKQNKKQNLKNQVCKSNLCAHLLILWPLKFCFFSIAVSFLLFWFCYLTFATLVLLFCFCYYARNELLINSNRQQNSSKFEIDLTFFAFNFYQLYLLFFFYYIVCFLKMTFYFKSHLKNIFLVSLFICLQHQAPI